MSPRGMEREARLLRAVLKGLGPPPRSLRAGAGEDDCAVVPWRGGHLVLTADLFREGVDLPRGARPERMGWMAAAGTLSDLAATGARPRYLLWCLGLPKPDPRLAAGVARGFGRCAREAGAAVVGGDIDRTPEVAVAGFAVGSAPRPVLRSGARPGDRVAVVGDPGLAEAALRLRRARRPLPPLLRRALEEPRPRIREGLLLARLGATAMADTSDSLAVSLHAIARASGVGFRLDGVPLHPALREVRGDPGPLALHGGGDYGLLFTAPPRRMEAVARRLRVHPLGSATRSKGISLRGRRVEERGYSPFR